jgi:hypothetical protein
VDIPLTMPSFLGPRLSSYNQDTSHKEECERDQQQHVFVTSEPGVAEFHRVITESARKSDLAWSPHLAELNEYVRSDDPASPKALPLSVCFEDLTTYGRPLGSITVTTLGHAIWRTLTLQDVYESTLGKFVGLRHADGSHALIRNFSGVCRNGEMTLYAKSLCMYTICSDMIF